jgi:isoleucyl-tRNA synthetase
LYISGNEKLESVVKKFESRIKKETLSLNVAYNVDRKYNKCDINGEELNIAVEVVE